MGQTNNLESRIQENEVTNYDIAKEFLKRNGERGLKIGKGTLKVIEHFAMASVALPTYYSKYKPLDRRDLAQVVLTLLTGSVLLADLEIATGYAMNGWEIPPQMWVPLATNAASLGYELTRLIGKKIINEIKQIKLDLEYEKKNNRCYSDNKYEC